MVLFSSLGAIQSQVTTSAFSPLDIASLRLWMDALDPANYTLSGSIITTFSNKKSGVVWPALATGAAYNATGYNGKPTFAFAGASAYVNTEAAVVSCMLGSPQPYTIISVSKLNNADASLSIFGAGLSTNATAPTRYFGNNTTGSGVYISAARNNSGGIVNVESASGSTDTANNTLIFRYDGNLEIIKNGVLLTSAFQSVSPLNPDRVAVGCRPASTPNVFFNGNQSDLYVFNAALAPTELSDMQTYLTTKWA